MALEISLGHSYGKAMSADRRGDDKYEAGPDVPESPACAGGPPEGEYTCCCPGTAEFSKVAAE